ncbi:MAG: 2,3,4,5-tetrahydropyridine-2,6-dicarboxylate N-succinyltransferase, partial [Bdellovibrionaceae bacterium]|nr:2,3,4,5-tetrahydropyridine-2,6-dicarboxylate N-succinyltransferase [Pseudobdellovibrionaceae bacterium]
MKNTITPLFEKAAADITDAEKKIIIEAMHDLDKGRIRVCENIDGQWVTHEW